MTSARTSNRDAQHVEALRQRDSQAVAALHAQITHHLSGALRHRGIGATDIDDFAQDACLLVLEKLDTYRGDASFSTWVAVVAVRSALARLRRSGSPASVRLDDHVAIAGDAVRLQPDRQVLTAELRDALEHGIHHELTERQREVIVAELNGQPQVRIAERLGMTPNAIYKMSHDARKKLKAFLTDRGLTPGQDHDPDPSTHGTKS